MGEVAQEALELLVGALEEALAGGALVVGGFALTRLLAACALLTG